MEGPIRVLIAGRDEASRCLIRSFLIDHPIIRIVAETDTVESTLAAVRQHQPDVVLLDGALDDERDSGYLTHEIKHISPDCMIVLPPHHEGPLDHVIKTVLENNTPVQPDQSDPPKKVDLSKPIPTENDIHVMVAPLRPRSTPPKADPHACPLTPRELEVVALIARDMSNKEIARELGVQLQTVKNHVSNALKRLGARSRVAAALMAKERRWIP